MKNTAVPKMGEQSIQTRLLLVDFCYKEVDFVRGRYKLPDALYNVPCQNWYGTSILSFKSSRGLTRGPGPFWLWYSRIYCKPEVGAIRCNYMVVDYGAKCAVHSDGVRWEFGENTVLRISAQNVELQD
jgi:hypothetical protein